MPIERACAVVCHGPEEGAVQPGTILPPPLPLPTAGAFPPRSQAHLWHTASGKQIDFGRVGEKGQLIGRQSSILVDPFSPLHHL